MNSVALASINTKITLGQLPERQRARLIIKTLSNAGVERGLTANTAGVSAITVTRWQKRFANGSGICDAQRDGRKPVYDMGAVNHFIAFYCQTTPLKGYGRWTLRWAEKELRLHPEMIKCCPSRSTMQRILKRHHLKPHRNRYFLQVSDPDFFPKMKVINDLYKNPPKNLFCFDECPGLQILQRIAPDMRPGDVESIHETWKEFEYIRNGTTDLFAFLEVTTGKISTSFHSNHTKKTFLSVMSAFIGNFPDDESIHLLMDNLASHCCYEFCVLIAEHCKIGCPPKEQLNSQDKRRHWLQNKEKRIIIYFTPFHGSWLNMAELCFRLINEKCLKDSYSSPEQLHQTVLTFVEQWNKYWAHPFCWKYDGKGLHGKTVLRFTSMLNRSVESMTLQFMTKECLLMVNLIKDYNQWVPPAHWVNLYEAIRSCETKIRCNITESNQPLVKQKAANAVDQLLEVLPIVIAKENHLA